MAEKTLSKVCYLCNIAVMNAEPYFRELLVNPNNGNRHSEQRYICCHCKGGLTDRCKRTIAEVFPRATRETMYATLKG